MRGICRAYLFRLGWLRQEAATAPVTETTALVGLTVASERV